MLRLTAVLMAVIGLIGCSRLDPGEFDRIVQFEPAPLYCYRSLGDATCYAKPLSWSQQDRMVGFYGPPPMGDAMAPMPVQPPPLDNRPPPPPMPDPRTPVDAKPLPRNPPPPAPPPSS